MILKTFAAAFVLAVAAALLSPIAAADKPIKEPAPFPEFVTGQFCEDFPVQLHTTVNRGVAHIFSSGAVLFTGSLKGELTNLETGKTIPVNFSGPGTISADGTTLTAYGRLLLFGEAGFFGPGAPPVLRLHTGRTVISLVDGSILSHTGHGENLCTALV